MLNITKSITLKGTSTIDGVVVEGYQAVINSANPNEMNISSWQQNKPLYKENRAQCRADKAEFEDAAYALQDELLAEKGAEEENAEA